MIISIAIFLVCYLSFLAITTLILGITFLTHLQWWCFVVYGFIYGIAMYTAFRVLTYLERRIYLRASRKHDKAIKRFLKKYKYIEWQKLSVDADLTKASLNMAIQRMHTRVTSVESLIVGIDNIGTAFMLCDVKGWPYGMVTIDNDIPKDAWALVVGLNLFSRNRNKFGLYSAGA